MEVRLLGSIEVIDDGQAVDLGPRKQRALLCLLALHANRVVTTDRILEELWGEDAAGKENALWVAISRLRSALEPDRDRHGDSAILLTRDHGYVLQVDPESIDINEFEAGVTETRRLLQHDPARAVERIDEALALWRDTPLEEFQHEEFALLDVARIEDLRLEALELRAEAELRRGRAREQISSLDALHKQHPLRERFVELLMRSLYQGGRQADALRVFGRYRRLLGEELGIEPSPELHRLEEQILLHDPSLRVESLEHRQPGSSVADSPFKGLRPFAEEDEADFFGRDRLVSDVIRRIDAGQRLVTLVGASGSGKSSVVQAGVVPAIRKGAIDESQDWLVAQMVPGARPIVELEAALLRSTLDAPDSLTEQLEDPTTGLLRAALRILPANSRLLLVIDQFEELFTLVDNDTERVAFLDLLGPALDDPHGRVTVLMTLRADFYDRPLAYPSFARRLGDGIINVSTLTPDELEAAVQEPMRGAHVAIEPALLAALLTDIIGHPGALPLFQYTLTMLFDRRQSGLVTVDAYRAMGGLKGALAQRAEDLWSELNDAEAAVARQLFLRFATITGDREWSRRRVTASELTSLRGDLISTHRVIESFAGHRLLTFDRDHVSGSPTVEVAHEALLTEWPRLQGWIDEASDDVLRHGALVAAMNEWRDAGRDLGYLLNGPRLEGYELWAASSAMQLTSDEQMYIDAAIDVREKDHLAEGRRLALEMKTTRSAKRRLWGLAAAVVALGGLAAFLFSGGIGGGGGRGAEIVFFGYPEDNGFGSNIASGLDRAVRDFGVELDTIVPFVEPGREFEQIAQDGAELIISDSTPAFLSPTVFEDFPEQSFGVIDGFVDSPNTAAILFANEQGSFLVGAAAALKSETGVIGYVGGFQVSILEEFRAGYEAGARHIDPDVEILATYIEQPYAEWGLFFVDPFQRPDLGKQRATVLYDRGADVVFHAASASGFGVFDAAVEQSDKLARHLWAIGVDNDQWFQADAQQRGHVLTSMIKRVDIAAYVLVSELVGAGFTGGVRELGLADDAFDFSRQGDGLTRAIIDQLEQIKADIAAGRIDVPTEPSGPLLILDRLPETFDVAFADLSAQQVIDYRAWLLENHSQAMGDACYPSGTINQCGQLMVSQLDNWLSTTN